jgi:hypothetical protein
MSQIARPTLGKDTLAYRVSKLWIRGVLAVAGVLEAGILSAALGMSEVPKRLPLLQFAQAEPVDALAAGSVLFGMSLTAWFITRRAEASFNPLPNLGSPKLPSGMVIATAISTLSITLFVSLLATVLVRPAWCPTRLCPAPIQVVVHHPGSVFDDHMEAYLTGIQSAVYQLPGDPATYSVSNLPQDTGVVRIDAPADQAYRVAVSMHSLIPSGYHIIIEHVSVVLVEVQPVPQPLNVWQTTPRKFPTNPFTATYDGQSSHDRLQAVPDFKGVMELLPGETDTASVLIQSNTLASLTFQIQVTYRMANEASAAPPLTLPQTYHVMFTDRANWRLYVPKDGSFVPATP